MKFNLEASAPLNCYSTNADLLKSNLKKIDAFPKAIPDSRYL